MRNNPEEKDGDIGSAILKKLAKSRKSIPLQAFADEIKQPAQIVERYVNEKGAKLVTPVRLHYAHDGSAIIQFIPYLEQGFRKPEGYNP